VEYWSTGLGSVVSISSSPKIVALLLPTAVAMFRTADFPPSGRDSTTPSLHHSITPSLHHSITPSLHHSITPSLHHSSTPVLLYS
jgi:hypothetical protein